MKRQESAEDYLETILILTERMGTVRSVDIAGAMGFSKPSVSVAMKHLRDRGLVAQDGAGAITLTDEGELAARRVLERHMVLTQLFVAIGVSEEIARADACRVEHDISEETFAKIKEHIQTRIPNAN